MRTVSTISSRSNGVTWNTVHVGGNRAASPQRMYSVRIETAPGILMEWDVLAGIQIPKCGGINQTPAPADTCMTPRIA
jgi:hypothetical protein